MANGTVPATPATPAVPAVPGAGGATGTWRLDPARSSVEFHVRHFYGLMTVKGRFDRYQGSLDLSARPAVELVIDADSLDTRSSSATSTCARTTSSTSSTTRRSASRPTPPRWTAPRRDRSDSAGHGRRDHSCRGSWRSLEPRLENRGHTASLHRGRCAARPTGFEPVTFGSVARARLGPGSALAWGNPPLDMRIGLDRSPHDPARVGSARRARGLRRGRGGAPSQRIPTSLRVMLRRRSRRASAR